MTIDQMRALIIQKYSNLWEVNDRAHRQEHFEAVFETGMYINNKLNLGFDPKLILLVAYFHDMFAFSRINHHHLSCEFVKSCDFELITDLNVHDRSLVATACYQHRASFKGEFSSKFSELMNSADRGFPDVSGEEIFLRSYACSLSKPGAISRTNTSQLALTHIKKKFGTGGYARFPELYSKAFAGGLEEQRHSIDIMNMDTIDEIFESQRNGNSALRAVIKQLPDPILSNKQ